ncbi:DUF3486 family protein [Kaustia mangrovi]|uniref:DUF3486 family protein n=1 Tax=Kaustia mangrovi TaxID=2593653 RepID=A0A7S8HDI3_9HYPH|nr:DUF3486 family protein [Kaustia mangrovi]QPC44504.1 DUF3486 family protein [Kaustia mangrovi]
MARRAGRGRLSSIEQLPEEAEPIVAWAMQELRARKHTQVDICEEFNKRLAGLAADMGIEIEPISLSSFNRYAIRLAASARRLEETRAIASALTERLGPDQADDLTVMVAETIKTLVFELLEGDGDITPKGAMELARALQSAVSAQSVSTDRRRKVEADFAKKAEDAVDKVAEARGLTAETVEAIKAKILGVSE